MLAPVTEIDKRSVRLPATPALTEDRAYIDPNTVVRDYPDDWSVPSPWNKGDWDVAIIDAGFDVWFMEHRPKIQRNIDWRSCAESCHVFGRDGGQWVIGLIVLELRDGTLLDWDRILEETRKAQSH